jgi:Uma2 family endonuclease
MASAILVSEIEYLQTVYEPDCEFIDGEVIERNVGEYPHSRLQGAIYSYFRRRRKKWGLLPIIEQRVQIRPGKFRIPDICVVQGPEPDERILTKPPLIWIEVLSSKDKPVRVNRKVQEVIAFGCAYVWVIDPETLESYVVTRESQYELTDGMFRIEELGVEVPLGQLEDED